MLKRLLDLSLALVGLAFAWPFLLCIAIAIKLDSKGPVLYSAKRIGRNGQLFPFHKFRTMRPNADKLGGITVGKRDPRVTNVGYWLRKLKLDELPQLLNVFTGDISIVGPRPEVPQYMDYYTAIAADYYKVKPGITCYSSIYFSNENELLANADDPELTYTQEIIPKKVELDMKYAKEQSTWVDIQIIFRTVFKIARQNVS